MQANSKSKPKSNFPKISPIRDDFAGATVRLRATGALADESMKPGKYRVTCESAEVQPRYKSIIVILVCKVSEGNWRDGVVFKQWLNIKNAKGDISPATVYARHCALALGRPIQAGDDLDPHSVFVGKQFLADVGFSLRDEAGKFADDNSQTKKSDSDYLRIHKLLELL